MQALAHVARRSQAREPDHRKRSGGLAPWRLRRAKDMFLADLHTNLSLQFVASACKLSVSHFSREFKTSTGVSPHQWLLVEVAGICGFVDQSHFTRVFARTTGTSPGLWRREHQMPQAA